MKRNERSYGKKLIKSLFLVTMIMSQSDVSAQAINKYIGDFAPSTPEAASFQKFTDVSVNTASGIPSIGLPIHQIVEGPIQVDIALSYNATGIKVGETASWVGLGWNLSGAGMISRSVVGYRDDHANGYLFGACENIQNNGATTGDLDNMVSNFIDCEPDIFYINLPGYAGKMIYAPHATSNGGWYVYPKNNVVVQEILSGYTITGFEIKTPDGNKYLFGAGEEELSSFSNSQQLGTGSAYVTTIWYLKSITSADGLHWVNYQYADEHTEIQSLGSNAQVSNAVVAGASCSTSYSNLSEVQNTYSFSDGKRLSKITCSSGTEEVDFIPAASQRADISSGNQSAVAKALDRIEISSSAYCKKFVFSHSYSNASATFPYQKRLILDQVQELSCNNSTSIPATIFTYNNLASLPSRLSKQVDHWGYYNGASSNEPRTSLIPGNASITYNGEKIYYNNDSPSSGANREPDTVSMQTGVLTQVKYPTGGTTDYHFASNTEYGCRRSGVYEIPVINKYSNCSTDPNFNYNSPCITLNAQELSSSEFRLLMYLGGGANGCPQESSRFNVRVKAIEDVSSNPAISIYDFTINNPMANENTPYYNVQDKFNPPLVPDKSYLFQLTIEAGPFFGNGDITFVMRYLPEENNIVGGLRVEEITTKENPSATPIKTTYQYHDSLGKSTGVLILEPRYGYLTAFNLGGVGIMKKFTSSPLTGTTDMDGNAIVYKKVQQIKENLGKVVFEYNPQKIVTANYPILPLPPTYTNDKLISQSTVDEMGTEIARLEMEYFVPPLSAYGPSQQYFVEKQVCDNLNIYLNTVYTNPVPSYARNPIQTQTLDGLTTIKENIYDSYNQFTFPVEEIITNSDNKVHKTKYYYILDVNQSYPDTNIINKLVAQHKLLPAWRTEKLVGNQVVDGTRTLMGFYDAAGLATGAITERVYARYLQRLETTWDDNGAVLTSGWQPQKEINEYASNSSQPTKVYYNGYADPMLLTYYGNRLLHTIAYKDHVSSFVYNGTSKLLSNMTGVDGQITEVSYDPLVRLQSSSQRLGNVYDNYTYHYAQGGDPYNWIKKVSNFALQSGSLLQTMENKSYMDGLGRPSLSLMVQHSPDLKDVASASSYDEHNRPIGQSILVESLLGDGSFVNVAPATPKQTTTYEANQLNRTATQTPPSWYASTSTYGSNTLPMTSPWAYVFAANTLSRATSMDPDNKVNITYTDKVGRLVVSQSCNQDESQCVSTWHQYDDKNRETVVYPPGSSTATTELLITKRYDGDDNVIYLKMPDAAAENYTYNSRNLLTGSRNAILAAESKWMISNYDDYGRLTQRGKGLDPVGENPTIQTLLEEYFYDGFDGTNTNSAPNYKDKLRKKRIKQLDDLGANNTWLETEYSYDNYGRVETEIHNNQLGGSETMAFTYDFMDNITTESHAATLGGVTFNKQSARTYDHQGRQKKKTSP